MTSRCGQDLNCQIYKCAVGTNCTCLRNRACPNCIDGRRATRGREDWPLGATWACSNCHALMRPRSTSAEPHLGRIAGAQGQVTMHAIRGTRSSSSSRTGRATGHPAVGSGRRPLAVRCDASRGSSENEHAWLRQLAAVLTASGVGGKRATQTSA